MPLRLFDLDPEVLAEIQDHLDAEGVSNLSNTCKKLSGWLFSLVEIIDAATKRAKSSALRRQLERLGIEELVPLLGAHDLLADLDVNDLDGVRAVELLIDKQAAADDPIFVKCNTPTETESILRDLSFFFVTVDVIGNNEFNYGAPSDANVGKLAACARECSWMYAQSWKTLQHEFEKRQSEFPHVKTEKNGVYSRAYFVSKEIHRAKEIAIAHIEQLWKEHNFKGDSAFSTMHVLFAHRDHIDPRAVPRRRGFMLPARMQLRATPGVSCAPAARAARRVQGWGLHGCKGALPPMCMPPVCIRLACHPHVTPHAAAS